MGSTPLPHIAIFPFLSKGHTIPLIHLAHLILRRRLANITFFTTPLNAPFLRNSLADADVSIVELPFPQNVPELPSGVESTDALPSISLFLPFVTATKLLRPFFERAVPDLPAISLLISDGFLGWTYESAAKFGIPRFVFYGMGNFTMTVSALISIEKPHARIKSASDPFAVSMFKQLDFTKDDLNPPFDDPNASGPHHEFVNEQAMATMKSHGIVTNSFYELESEYNDVWNSVGPKAWCVGPLCSARPKASGASSKLTRWLDEKLLKKRKVLYVAFGSQADVSVDQVKEIAAGLEISGLDFVWVVRGEGIEEGFEERVRERGTVVKEWVDQYEILQHSSVEGFVSHCGWNSVTESVCAAVPVLAWPMMADQHLNARFVVDVLGIGLRVRSSDGTKHGLVKREEIAGKAKELLMGEMGRVAKEKVRVLADAAETAMKDGGSSAITLEQMIEEASRAKITG